MHKFKAASIAAIATLGVAAPAVIPSVASANATTRTVARQFTRQVQNRARVEGFGHVRTHVKCANDGGGYYSCYATVAYSDGNTFGILLDVTPRGWHTVGRARQIG